VGKLARFVSMNGDVTYCKNAHEFVRELGPECKPDDWRPLIVSSRYSNNDLIYHSCNNLF
jgi:hypothetical protein